MSEPEPDEAALAERNRAPGDEDRARLLLQAVLDQCPVPLVVVDAREARLLYANRATAEFYGLADISRFTGMELEEIWRQNLWRDLDADGHELTLDRVPLGLALQGKATSNMPICILRRDGVQRWVLVNGAPVFSRSGELWAGVAAFVDITDRRRAEEAQRAGDERLRRMLQNSNDILAVMDAQGKLTAICGSFERTLGLRPEEMLGRSAFEIIHPDDVGRARATFTEAMAQPAAFRRDEYRLRHKDGSWVTVEVAGTRLLDDPLVQGVVLNVRDISERTRLEAQLQQAMKMEAVGRLAGGVAHDFNNLLTVIRGNVELAGFGSASPDALAQCLAEIGKAAESATELTRKLLAFSRQQIIAPVVLSLNDLVRDLEPMLRRLLGEDILLRTALDQALGKVRVDPGQFEQVLMNLAVNARDAMPDGGRLTLETRNVELDEAYCALHSGVRPGPRVLLSVSDTGHGIPPEVREHLFEPFFTTKPAGQGTGLGLATIFGAVKQAGGSIEVYSEPGLGAAFKLLLPRAEGPVDTRPAGGPSTASTRGSETVLLVEDDPGVRDVVRTFLQRQGYQVLQASNGAEALSVARQHPGRIELLMTDVIMPGLNGREVAEKLLEIHTEMKVLFTSGYTEDVIVRHGIEERSLSFIGKPYAFQDLARKLRQILDPGEATPGG
jgi:two-component system, cell cycle sensor histidine kinase and response regulator CckA